MDAYFSFLLNGSINQTYSLWRRAGLQKLFFLYFITELPWGQEHSAENGEKSHAFICLW